MWLPETKSVPALREWAGLPAEDEPHLAALVARVKKNKALSQSLEMGANLLFEKDENGEYRALTPWQPPVEEETGLSLLIALAALPSIRWAHAIRHVDTDITRATCREVGIWVDHWKRTTHPPEGTLGIHKELLPWFRLVASGELYRLGRLEFVRETFSGPIIALQHQASGEIVTLANDGILFSADGYITDIDAPGTWTTSLHRDETTVRGVVIGGDGRATKETRTLSFTEWRILLDTGATILTVHIPEGEPLTMDACHESFAQARRFFPASYPGQPVPVAFVCQSWLLDSAWTARLPDSNIVAFQKLGHLYPVRTAKREGLFHIFGTSEPDPATAPRETRLQRALLDAYTAGQPLRAEGLFLPF